MTKHYDVIIVGAGLVGSMVAIGLAKQQCRVALVDSQDITPKQKSDGRASALGYGSGEILKQYGLFDDLESHLGPILDIRVSDQGSRSILHYDHQLVGDSPMGYMVENHDLRHVAFEHLSSQPNISLYLKQPYKTINLSDHHAQLTLENDTVLKAPLLIAADGRRSAIRRQQNIPTLVHDYQQVGIVCTIKHQHHHQHIAQERFLSTGPFAVLPLKDGYHVSLVWTESTALAPLYLAMPSEQILEHVQERLQGYLGNISLASKVYHYPLILAKAKRYTDTRLALLGDAACGVHPLAGQGFNLGLRSAHTLTQLILKQQSLGLDIGSQQLLRQYHKDCQFDSQSMLSITHGLNALFLNQNALVQWGRRTGMAMVNHTPPLKKFFMRHAMGVTS